MNILFCSALVFSPSEASQLSVRNVRVPQIKLDDPAEAEAGGERGVGEAVADVVAAAQTEARQLLQLADGHQAVMGQYKDEKVPPTFHFLKHLLRPFLLYLRQNNLLLLTRQ